MIVKRWPPSSVPKAQFQAQHQHGTWNDLTFGFFPDKITLGCGGTPVNEVLHKFIEFPVFGFFKNYSSLSLKDSTAYLEV